MNQEKVPTAVSPFLETLLVILGVVAFITFMAYQLIRPPVESARHRGRSVQRAEITELVNALENFRIGLGQGEYPPSSSDDPSEVQRFLAKAFPKYRGGLPEKYKNLDPASSLVFWLGGVTDNDGKLIGFSTDPKDPFDATTESRMPMLFEFELKRLRTEGGLLVFFPRTANDKSDPYVYFRPDAKGAYHGAWHNCRPCRDSKTGDWINSTTYQLFGPGVDGKYGSGIQYPSGADYDEARKDDMSNFTQGPRLGDDMLD
jgi:hypothetical protein